MEIEVNAGSGDPAIVLVGLPDAAVRESKDRVTTAIANSGFRWPRSRTTVNLAPADLRKEGPSFDLPIAVGMIAVAQGAELPRLGRCLMAGELALNGEVRPIKGTLPIAMEARRQRKKAVIVPKSNAREAAVVDGIEVYGVSNLRETFEFLAQQRELLAVRELIAARACSCSGWDRGGAAAAWRGGHGLARHHRPDLVRSLHRPAADHARSGCSTRSTTRSSARFPGTRWAPAWRSRGRRARTASTYEFKLRRGLKFHNGDPVTAEDVKFSFERYQGAGAKELQARVQQRGDRRSPHRALPAEGAVAGLHDLLRHDGDGGRHRRAQEVPRRRSATMASGSIPSAPVPTSSSATRPASRSCWRPTAGYWRHVPTRQAPRHEERPGRRPRALAMLKNRRGRHRRTPSTAPMPRNVKRDPRLQIVASQARVDLPGSSSPSSGIRSRRGSDKRLRLAVNHALDRKAHQRGGLPRLLPAGRRDRPARHGLRPAGRAPDLRSARRPSSCWPRPAIRTGSTLASWCRFPPFFTTGGGAW